MSLPIDHARLPKPGDTFGSKYRLECILGSGGMGVVFGATHLITHKRVAIKWLAGEPDGASLSDTTQRFVREARLAGEFQHPNVVQVYDLGESEGSFYMVMEWLEGESLAARLERVTRLSFEETLVSLIPCMHAMQRAHDMGIIHRDIKPANIFLCDATSDKPAQSKVLDFGISKRITSHAEMSSFVTKTGMLVGTPHYLAPEQLRARPVDRRTDVYGFGVLLYQTLAGALPFTADNFGDLIVEISVGTLRPLREHVPDLPVGVEYVVARAMARDPNERYATLHELITSLEAIDPVPLTAATLPQISAPPSLRPLATEPDERPRSRANSSNRVVLGAAIASGLVAGAGLLLLLRQPAHEAAPSFVRPRATTTQAARDPEPSPLPTGAAIPSALQVGPKQEADASTDGGRPVPPAPVRPREPAKDPAPPKTKAAVQARVTAKPAAPSEAAQPPAATPKPPAEEKPEPEYNPLRMNIQ